MTPRRAARGGRGAALLVLLALTGIAGIASAQGFGERLRVGGEIAFGSELLAASGADAEVRTRYGVRVDASLDLSPVTVDLVAEPALLVPNPLRSLEPGEPALLTSAGVETLALRGRAGPVDLSLGIELLPVTEARLLTVASLEPNDELGRPRGLPNARATLFARAWRVRTALLSDVPLPWEERRRSGLPAGALAAERAAETPFAIDLGGALSVRYATLDVGLEAHLAYLRRLAFGLTGNGLLGDVVLYGDAWILFDPWQVRALVGASSYWGDALWTAELGLVPQSSSAVAVPALDLAASVELPLDLGDDTGTLTPFVRATLLEPTLGEGGDAVRVSGFGALELRVDRLEGSLSLRPFATWVGEDVGGGASLELRVFY